MPDPQLEVRMPGEGPRVLGLTAAERNRRIATRALAKHSSLAGTLQFSDDSLIVTQALFDWLPRRGSWQIDWHDGRPPFMWEASSAGVVGRATAPTDAVLDVRSPAARQRATWALLRCSGKPTDGWLSRHVHRKVSRVVSHGLLAIGLTANDATLLTVAIGALSAWFIAQTSHLTMIAGAFLFWFASIADGVDGEMARVTLSESARGEQLDTFADIATYVMCLVGVTVGWARQGMGPEDRALAAIVVLGVPTTQLYAMQLIRRASGAAQFFVDSKPMEGAVLTAARDTGAPPLQLAAGVWLAFRRESFSALFFLGSLLTAWRGYAPAALGAALLFVLSTLAVYGAPIERALRQGRGVVSDAR